MHDMARELDFKTKTKCCIRRRTTNKWTETVWCFDLVQCCRKNACIPMVYPLNQRRWESQRRGFDVNTNYIKTDSSYTGRINTSPLKQGSHLP